MQASRRIAHLDMDMFFAGVELLQYPELRGLPVVVGGGSRAIPQRLEDGTLQVSRLRDYVGRGVVTTSTYEARALGVFSAMGMMKAAKLAPDAILLPSNFDSYRHFSRQFKQAVAAIAPVIEDRGIDEIYIDLSEHAEATLPLAQRIKAAVHAATGLTCSIGIASNKLLAKVCSELDKPDGITILPDADIPVRIWPLKVGKINGIGPKAAARLNELGLHSIGDLAHGDPAVLQSQFGLHYARWLVDVAHGRDERPIVTSSTPKSMSRETTFGRDLHVKGDRAELSAIFTGLCERVAEDLQRKHFHARTIGIKLRFQDFSTVTRDLSMPLPSSDAAVIRRAAGECLKRISMRGRIRLLGVRASGLSDAELPQPGQAELLF